MLTNLEIAHALQHLRPGAQWNIRGEEIEWLDKVQTQPTNREIAAACRSCNPEKESFRLLTSEQKISYLAKRLGLED